MRASVILAGIGGEGEMVLLLNPRDRTRGVWALTEEQHADDAVRQYEAAGGHESIEVELDLTEKVAVELAFW